MRFLKLAIVCSLMLTCVPCKAEILGAAALEIKKNNPPEVPRGDGVYTKCVLGYMFLMHDGTVVQVFVEGTEGNSPQPMKCEK